MAYRWGKINDGDPFHRITKDLLRPLLTADLGKYDGCLIASLIDESWTKPYVESKRRPNAEVEPVPFRVPCSQIARDFGCPKQRISKAKRTLIARRIMIELPDGTVLFNKNVDDWIGLDGQPQFTEGQLQLFIRDGMASSKKTKTTHNCVTKKGRSKPNDTLQGDETGKSGGPDTQLCDVLHASENPVSGDTQLCDARPENDTQLCDATTHSAVSSHYIGTRPSEDSEDFNTRGATHQFAGGRDAGGGETIGEGPRKVPDFPAVLPRPTDVHPGPHEPDWERVDFARGLAMKLWINDRLGLDIRAHARQWPSEWFVRVVKRLWAQQAYPHSFKLLRTILNGWDRKGGPDAGPEDDYDDRLEFIPQSKRGVLPLSKPGPRPTSDDKSLNEFIPISKRFAQAQANGSPL